MSTDKTPDEDMTWCACGDGYPLSSYGAGFMAANNGVCENCDSSETENEALRKDAIRYRWICEKACDVTFWAAGQYPVEQFGSAKPQLDRLIDESL